MSVETLAKIDELILNVVTLGGEDGLKYSNNEYSNLSNILKWKKEYKYNQQIDDNDDNADWYWLKQSNLSFKIWRPQMISIGDSFIIVGSENSDKCYIYNIYNNKLELINLDTIFPECIYDRRGKRNEHQILEVNIDGNNININDDTKQYLICGTSRDDNNNMFGYIIKSVYNIKKHTLQFINITNNFDTKWLSICGNMKLSFKLNATQIIIFGYTLDTILIFDYMNNKYKQYNPDELEDIAEDTYFEGIVNKTQNELIIWGNNKCYLCVINNTDNNNNTNIDSYLFSFTALSSISSIKHEITDWDGFSYIVYNDFIICFGGIFRTTNADRDISRCIYIYDMNNNIWYEADREIYLLPDKTFNTKAILNNDEDKLVVHIIGGVKEVAASTTDECVFQIFDANHWRLNLGYTNNAKKEIWKIFMENEILSSQLEISKLLYDFIDIGFMSSFLNRNYKPYI